MYWHSFTLGDFYPQEVDFSNLIWDSEHQFDTYSPLVSEANETDGRDDMNNSTNKNSNGWPPASLSLNTGEAHSTVQIPPAAPVHRDIYIPVNKRKNALGVPVSGSKRTNSSLKHGKDVAGGASNALSDNDEGGSEDDCAEGASKGFKSEDAADDALGGGIGDRRCVSMNCLPFPASITI